VTDDSKLDKTISQLVLGVEVNGTKVVLLGTDIAQNLHLEAGDVFMANIGHKQNFTVSGVLEGTEADEYVFILIIISCGSQAV